ncbi:MAG: sensor histidine kinase, partial [Weeksellaceae bacterium]|nr:sensor histidine kinase [Weeksellaceae bacterium]
MRFGLKNRRFIHFSLIVCTILIQLIILLFFYNEYFNERKLTVIWKQLEDTRMLKQLTDNSRKELTTARSHLHKYLADNQREDLEMYFQSLRNLNGNIDSIKSYENTFTLLKSENNSVKRDFPELGTLEGIIDSVYSLSKENRPSTDDNFQIKKVEIDKGVEKFEMEITHTTDSIEKKKFFPRVFDAIKGDVPVQRDTVYI